MNKVANPTPRHGISYQEMLDLETVPVPGQLRTVNNPDLGPPRLDPSRYTSRAFHDLEMKHIWTKVWQLACRVEDLPNVGDHLLYEVGDVALIVVRTGEDEIRALHNSCLHRGRKLVTEAGCKSSFRCPYHAWTWNIDGSIKFVPCRKDFEHAGEGAFQLPQARVGVWQGFVFVNPSNEGPSLEDFLEVLPNYLDMYELDRCRKVIHVQKVIACNWKIALEAFMESYHVIATHPQLMTFMGDANAQYDVLSDHVNRAITGNATHSPHVKGISEQQILEDTLRESGRVFTGEQPRLPEGMTARQYLAQLNREAFGKDFGRDFSQVTDSELLDAILYWLFPNIEIWGGWLGNIVYRSRPNGHDPDSCLFEIMLLQRQPAGVPVPPGVPAHLLGPDECFSDAAELAVLGKVFDQDMDNLPHMQSGLKAAGHNGKGGLLFGTYLDSRIQHMHAIIDTYIARGAAT